MKCEYSFIDKDKGIVLESSCGMKGGTVFTAKRFSMVINNTFKEWVCHCCGKPIKIKE